MLWLGCSPGQPDGSGTMGLLVAAQCLPADTSRAGGEAAGNKEPRSSRTCPGKAPPLFAVIILFFSILHPHNNVSGPVFMLWITQRLQLRSRIRIFPEYCLCPIPCTALEKVTSFLFFHVACARELGDALSAKPPTCVLTFISLVAFCTCKGFCSVPFCSRAVGFIKFMFLWPHRNLQAQ